jgi:hypothetical protein
MYGLGAYQGYLFDLDNVSEITSVVSAFAVTLAFHTAMSEQK